MLEGQASRSYARQMQAIEIDDSELVLRKVPAPPMVAGCVRIQVAATAVNRADLLQRRGLYPPPPGASHIPGLECAGTVCEIADDVDGWHVGDRVMALLTGGGYADEVVTPAGSLLRVPDGLSLPDAAALPEAIATVQLNLFRIGGLRRDRPALVHGGSSGIGTTALTMARLAGARLLVTAGSDQRCARCLELGAEVAINYHTTDFAAAVRDHTDGVGVDVVLDCVGGPYLEDNLRSLAHDGRLVVIGLLGGSSGPLPMGLLLGRRLSVVGSTLRSRSEQFRNQLVAEVFRLWGNALESGTLTPVVDTTMPIALAADAHRRMEHGDHFGKIVLVVSGRDDDMHARTIQLQ